MADSETPSLADQTRHARSERGWTQEQLADKIGVSRDSVSRIERGEYSLPQRPSEKNAIDRVVRWLGLDLGPVIRQTYPAETIRASAYARFIDETPRAAPPEPAGETLTEYMAALPTTPEGLIARASMIGAKGMVFLIALERAFSSFEYLITNEPPYMLFADEEYVHTGSAVQELDPGQRRAYLDLLTAHQQRMRAAVKSAAKHYRVVIHRESLIRFLAAIARRRATAVVRAMRDLLVYPGLDIVVLDAPDRLDELEVLSDRPLDDPSGHRISVRHRRIGTGATIAYELALVATNSQLVAQDFAAAERLWHKGVSEVDRRPDEWKRHLEDRFGVERKCVAAWLLGDALRRAHPPASKRVA